MLTLISARWVIGWDGTTHRIIENGEVVFDERGVRFVGRCWQGVVGRRIDYGNAVVGPGFVDLDALSDIDSTILGFDNAPGWRKGRVWPVDYLAAGPREALDDASLDAAKRWAWLHLLQQGITTVAPISSIIYRAWSETVEEWSRAVDIAAEVGVRAYLGPAYCSGRPIVDVDGRITMHFDSERGMAGLEAAQAFVRQHNKTHGGLVRGFLAPDRIEGCTESLLRASRDAALELAVPIRLHCCQSELEVRVMAERVGGTSLQWLEQIGFLDARPLLPHGTQLGGAQPTAALVEADIGRLLESRSTLVHCPLVMARTGQALRSFGSLRRRGVAIAMGTDTFPADMLMNLQVGVLMARMVDGDEVAVSAADLYDAATIGGADALGRSDLGRLATGTRADITVFDLDDPRTGPFVDAIQSMVIGGAGLGFRDVFVEGRQVIRDRRPADHDVDALHAEMNRVYAAFRQTYPARAPGHPSVDALFPPAYPKWDPPPV